MEVNAVHVIERWFTMNPLQDKHFTLPASELVRLLHDTRERTLALIDDLSDAQLEVPYIDIVNPLRWELGHIAFFYETFIPQMFDGNAPIMPGADNLYDSFKVDHEDRWSLPLPSRQGTQDYIRQVLDA